MGCQAHSRSFLLVLLCRYSCQLCEPKFPSNAGHSLALKVCAHLLSFIRVVLLLTCTSFAPASLFLFSFFFYKRECLLAFNTCVVVQSNQGTLTSATNSAKVAYFLPCRKFLAQSSLLFALIETTFLCCFSVLHLHVSALFACAVREKRFCFGIWSRPSL